MEPVATAVTPVLAHGLGDASLLPLPLQTVLLLAGASVLVTAWSCDRRDRRDRGGRARPVAAPVDVPSREAVGAAPRAAGRALTGLGRLVDARGVRLALRLLGLLAGVVVVALCALGPAGYDTNPGPRLLVVVTWAGLIPLSLLAPGAYRALNPLRALAGGVVRLIGDPEGRGARPLPVGVGVWPAVVPLAVFLGLYAAVTMTPTVTFLFLVTHALAQVGGAVVYGRRWFEHADPFEVTAALIGRLSPLGRRPDGVLVVGGVRRRLAAPVAAGATAVVALLVGSSLADFAADTSWWQALSFDRSPAARTALDLGGLAAWTAVSGVLIAAGTRVRGLGPALVPLVTAYGIAHYLAVILVEGQIALAQVAAVAAGGLQAVDRAALVADYELLPGTLASSGQLTGFLLLHVVAVVVGRDVATARYPARTAGRAQLALRAVLVVSAVGGTLLRYSAA